MRHTEPDDIIAVVATGVFAALVFSAWAFAQAQIRGPEEFERFFGIPIYLLVGLYFLGGLLAGTVVAVLFPLRDHLLGAMAIGYLAAVPVFSLFTLTGDYAGGREDWVLDTLMLSALGSAVGAFLWLDSVRRRR